MNTGVAARKCNKYEVLDIYSIIAEIYEITNGPEVEGKKVLVKPNILTDDDPSKCISTHPSVVEAMIRFLQTRGAIVFGGDSPAVHGHKFRGIKSGIAKVCETTGVEWVDFTLNPREKKIKKQEIKIASVVNNVDIIIS